MPLFSLPSDNTDKTSPLVKQLHNTTAQHTYAYLTQQQRPLDSSGRGGEGGGVYITDSSIQSSHTTITAEFAKPASWMELPSMLLGKPAKYINQKANASRCKMGGFAGQRCVGGGGHST